MVTEIFWTFLISSVIAMILTITRMCYKSKCTKFSCCGIAIERDVITEEKIDEMNPSTNASDQV